MATDGRHTEMSKVGLLTRGEFNVNARSDSSLGSSTLYNTAYRAKTRAEASFHALSNALSRKSGTRLNQSMSKFKTGPNNMASEKTNTFSNQRGKNLLNDTSAAWMEPHNTFGSPSTFAQAMIEEAYERLQRNKIADSEAQEEEDRQKSDKKYHTSSMWKLAAKANQEDFKTFFESQKNENSHDLEKKLNELVKREQAKPSHHENTISP